MTTVLLEAVATPFFAILDFTLAAPWAATGTLTAMGITAVATIRFFVT